MRYLFVLLFILVFFMPEAIARERIQSILYNRGTVRRVQVHPGLGTLITLPCFITEAFLGNEADAMVKVTPKSDKSIYISLKRGSSKSTNLIVRCENENIVFELEPSTTHQDIINVRGIFGSPQVESDPSLLNSPQDEKNPLSKKDPPKIESKQPPKRKLVQTGVIK